MHAKRIVYAESRMPRDRMPARSGFTLAEVIISMGLGCMLLAAVSTTTLHLSKASLSAQNYFDMESDYQSFLQHFQQDTWLAASVDWVSASEVSLTTNGATVNYVFDSSSAVVRRVTASETRTLIENVAAFTFVAFDSAGNSLALTNPALRAVADDSTKSIQVEIETQSSISSSEYSSGQTARMTSSRWMLRNKRLL